MRGNSSPSTSSDPIEGIDLNSTASVYELLIEPKRCPHVKIKIVDSEINALLDSGAEISVMNSLNLITKYNFKLHKSKLKIETAGNTSYSCLGFVNLPITFNGVTKEIRVYMVSKFSKTLILGINSWKSFKIVPAMQIGNNKVHVIQDSTDNQKAKELNFVEDYFSNNEDSISLKFINYIGSVEEHMDNEEDLSLDIPTLDIEPSSIENIETEHELSSQERAQLIESINCFTVSEENKIGRTSKLEHEIKIIPGVEIKPSPMYRCSPYIQKYVDEEINRMIQMDVIEPCNSEFASPLLPVKKSNGKFRVCLDSRRVNSATKNDAYPMPNLHEILHRIEKAKFFSVIDLKEAYWQIPLAENSRNYTAFKTRKGLFRFKVMPFGLKGAPFTMSKLMDLALGCDLQPFVWVYLDDIIIATKTLNQHFQLIREVAKRLKSANLTISLSKSKFCRKSVRYLGYVVSEQGISIDMEKIRPILDYQTPKSVKDVRRLLGLANFYQKFIKKFSDITAPISDLLKKDKKKFLWTPEADKALDQLKESLINPPILANPDFDEEFTIESDASDLAVGAVLTQVQKGEKRVIAYFSKKLNSTRRKYAAVEKECLAVLWAIEAFRHYVEGVHFRVITDARSLVWLSKVSAEKGSAKLCRWALKLQQFDFIIEYRKGRDNITADCLSRSLNAISKRWEDLDYKTLKDKINENPNDYKDFKIVDDNIYKYVKNNAKLTDRRFDWKMVPTKEERIKIIKNIHEEAHLGFEKTLEKIREKYVWPLMYSETKQFCSGCVICKTSKSDNVNHTPPMGKQKLATHPWQIVAVDYVGPFPRAKKTGNTCLLVITDIFTKFVIIQPLKEAKSKQLVYFMENMVFLLFGVPEIVLSDNGTQFVSKEFKSLLEKYSVNQWLTPVYFPQVNNAERANRVITSAIRALIKKEQNLWDENIYKIANAINNASHTSSGFSPYFVNFGRNQISSGEEYQNLRDTNSDQSPIAKEHAETMNKIHEEVRKNLKIAYEKYSKYYNLRSGKLLEFEVGQKVLKMNHFLSDKTKAFNAKLAPKFSEAIIKKRVGNVCYMLQDINGKSLGLYHVSQLKKL